MNFEFHRYTKAVLAVTLTAVFLAPPALPAEDHVVSSGDLQQQTRSVMDARQVNITMIEKFLSSEPAVKVLDRVGVDAHKVTQAVPLLNDRELAEMASRADKAQADFAAGSLTNQQLTYIIIALATAVIVILIFEA